MSERNIIAEIRAKNEDERTIEEVFVLMRAECGWPQPWADIMQPGIFDDLRTRVAENRLQRAR